MRIHLHRHASTSTLDTRTIDAGTYETKGEHAELAKLTGAKKAEKIKRLEEDLRLARTGLSGVRGARRTGYNEEIAEINAKLAILRTTDARSWSIEYVENEMTKNESFQTEALAKGFLSTLRNDPTVSKIKLYAPDGRLKFTQDTDVKLLARGAEYEGRFWYGAYSAARLNSRMIAKDAPMRAAILAARESYNALRVQVGLPLVTAWEMRPLQTMEQLLRAPK